LLDRREEAVEVDVEEVKAVGLGRGGHGSYWRLYSPFICFRA